MERTQYLLVAGLFVVLLLIGGRLGLGLFHEDIEDGIQEAQAEIRTLQWAVTGTELTLTDLQTVTNETDDLTNWTAPNDTPIVVNATVHDETVTAYDPATLELHVHNTANETYTVGGGLTLQLLTATRTDGNDFQLWSPAYPDMLGYRPSGYIIEVVPAAGVTEILEPGEGISRNYTIHSGIPDVTTGNYTVISGGNIERGTVHPPGETHLRYELSFRLTATD